MKMIPMTRPVALLATLVLAMPWQAEAYPTAAGKCPAGEAAVSNSHIMTTDGKTITNGTLAEGGFSVLLNGQPLEGNAFRVEQEETLTITTTESSTFRGFLIRIAPPEGTVADVRDALQPVFISSDEEADTATDTDTQLATLTCVEVEQVGGLTHTSNNDKMEVSGTLLVEQAISGLSIDITVVGENSDDSSTYWYSHFDLKAIGVPTSPPSMAPSVNEPTTSPVEGNTTPSEVEGPFDPPESSAKNYCGSVRVIAWITLSGIVSGFGLL